MPASALTPDDAVALYGALQAGPLAGSAITTLHIGGAQTTLASGTGPAPQVLTLDIGARATAAAHFRHPIPTAAELEHAIMVVEDAVMPARAALSPDSVLYTADAGIRQVAIAAGLEAQPELLLTLPVLEAAFNRVADIASGSPAAAEPALDDPAYAPTLLILRECLHHLGFSGIVIRSDAVV